MLKACLVNYNFDPQDWWLDYEFDPEDVVLYDRSDDGIERKFAAQTVTKTENKGDVDYDKLSYLIDNYDSLPDVFLWSKTNIFKFISAPDLRKAIDRATFTPLLRQDHPTYADERGQVCRYSQGIYEERPDSWYFNNPALEKRVNSWEEWRALFGIPLTQYVPFAPGGSYILTKDRVHRYQKSFYEKMRDMLPHSKHPAEAHAAERSYYLLWS